MNSCDRLGVPQSTEGYYSEKSAGIRRGSRAIQAEYQKFMRGSYKQNAVYWHKWKYGCTLGFKCKTTDAAYASVEKMATAYENAGGTWSNSGFSTGDTYYQKSSCGYTGSMQWYESTKGYASPENAVFAKNDRNLEKYRNFGEVNSVLCYPTTIRDNYMEFDQGHILDVKLYGVSHNNYANTPENQSKVIQQSKDYLCSSGVPNYSTTGADRDQICDTLDNFVLSIDVNYDLPASYAGGYCPSEEAYLCDGILAGKHIGLGKNMMLVNDDYIAKTILHEGQHAHAHRRNYQLTMLEGEFRSLKLEGKYILDKKAYMYESIPAFGEVGYTMAFDTKLALDGQDASSYRLKNDWGLYASTCFAYFDHLSADEKNICIKDYNYEEK